MISKPTERKVMLSEMTDIGNGEKAEHVIIRAPKVGDMRRFLTIIEAGEPALLPMVYSPAGRLLSLVDLSDVLDNDWYFIERNLRDLMPERLKALLAAVGSA